MKSLFLLFLVPIIFSYAFAQESPTPQLISENLTPRMQVFNDVWPDAVVCKPGFELIFKSTNGNPACVKPDTAKRLLDVGWGSKKPFGIQKAEGLPYDETKGWLYSFCSNAGGLLRHGLAYESGPECNLPTSDAGKECTDGSQCESYCQAKEGAEMGSEGTGLCYGYQIATCMQSVLNGVVQQEWCE